MNGDAVVNDCERGSIAALVAAVVTRMKYCVALARSAAGTTANVAPPLLATGAAAIWTQVAKLSVEIWSAPAMALAVFVVNVATSIA